MLEQLPAVRIVATPEAIDGAVLPPDTIPMRSAPDELLVVGVDDPQSVSVDDPYAIVTDDTGWLGTWVDPHDAAAFLRHECAWPVPTARPWFAQGMIAGLPARVWLEEARVLFVVSHVRGVDFADRLRPFLNDGANA